MIECFAYINKKYPDYKLVIIGEGELEMEIKKYINDLNFETKILILPFQNNVFKYLKKVNVSFYLLYGKIQDSF